MSRNFLVSLFSNPKGNAITRQVKRAEHQLSLEKAKRGGEATLSAAMVYGLTKFCGISDANVLGGTLVAALSNLAFKNGTFHNVGEAVTKCNNLKASQAYREVLDRANTIKLTNMLKWYRKLYSQ